MSGSSSWIPYAPQRVKGFNDDDDDDDDNNNKNIYLLQLGCHPVAVVILHVVYENIEMMIQCCGMSFHILKT